MIERLLVVRERLVPAFRVIGEEAEVVVEDANPRVIVERDEGERLFQAMDRVETGRAFLVKLDGRDQEESGRSSGR